MTVFLATILAQTATQPATAPPGGLFTSPIWLFVMMAAVVYFVMIRPQGAEKKKRAAMLAAIKKNDRVVTAGGIHGTVVNVKDDEITLKVDESTNTKLTFARWAIQRVASSQTAASPTSGNDEPKR